MNTQVLMNRWCSSGWNKHVCAVKDFGETKEYQYKAQCVCGQQGDKNTNIANNRENNFIFVHNVCNYSRINQKLWIYLSAWRMFYLTGSSGFSCFTGNGNCLTFKIIDSILNVSEHDGGQQISRLVARRKCWRVFLQTMNMLHMHISYVSYHKVRCLPSCRHCSRPINKRAVFFIESPLCFLWPFSLQTWVFLSEMWLIFQQR